MINRVLQLNISQLENSFNVIIQSNFFHDIYHVGCAIINLGLILGGQFCPQILETKITRILKRLT